MVRLTVPDMKKKEKEAGICWTGDVECGEGGGWAGM